MAKDIKLKIYKSNQAGGGYDLAPDYQATGSTYAASQSTEVSPQDFYKAYQSDPKLQQFVQQQMGSTTPGYADAWRQAISGNFDTLPTPYVTDPITGNLTTKSAIQQDAANKAGVANGTLREISPGMYVPVGSAGDQNLANIGTHNTANQANTASQFSLTGGNLQVGSRGDNVKQLQSLLDITADGIYGPQTKAAVIAYQKANGLTPDGIVGPLTTSSLSGKPPTLPPATPPNSADGINTGVGSVNLPNGNTTVSDISNANSTLTGSQTGTNSLQTQLDQFYNQQIQAQQKQSQENKSFLSTLFNNQQSQTDLTAQAESKFGVNTQEYLNQKKVKESEIASLTKEYQDTKTAMEEEKSKATDRLSTTGFISREQSAIERKYAGTLNRLATDINYQSALLSNLNGDFAQAQNLVQQAVSAATADQKDKMNMAIAFYEQNQNSFNAIQGIYKDAFLASISLQEKQLAQANDNLTKVLNLGLENPKAGILPTDTFAQAVAKINASGGTVDYQYRQAQMANVGKGSGVVKNSVEQSAREDIVGYINGGITEIEDIVQRISIAYPELTKDRIREIITGGQQTQAPVVTSTPATPFQRGQNISNKVSNAVEAPGRILTAQSPFAQAQAGGFQRTDSSVASFFGGLFGF